VCVCVCEWVWVRERERERPVTLLTCTVFSISNVFKAAEIEERIRQTNQYNEEHSQQWCPLWRAEQCTICGPSDNNRRFHCKFWISLGIRTVADNVKVKEIDVTNKAVHRPSIMLNSLFTWACLSRLKSFRMFFNDEVNCQDYTA